MASTGRWFTRWDPYTRFHPFVPYLTNVCFPKIQVFGTTELSEKPIMLPAFVDATHCLPYHLTSTGRAVADRIVNVLGYDCPDITYSPVLYPITSILLHFMSGELSQCQHSSTQHSTPLHPQHTWMSIFDRVIFIASTRHTKISGTIVRLYAPDPRLAPYISIGISIFIYMCGIYTGVLGAYRSWLQIDVSWFST